MSIAKQSNCYFLTKHFFDTFETDKKHKINELFDRSQNGQPKHTKKMTNCLQPHSLQVYLGPYCLY